MLHVANVLAFACAHRLLQLLNCQRGVWNFSANMADSGLAEASNFRTDSDGSDMMAAEAAEVDRSESDAVVSPDSESQATDTIRDMHLATLSTGAAAAAAGKVQRSPRDRVFDIVLPSPTTNSVPSSIASPFTPSPMTSSTDTLGGGSGGLGGQRMLCHGDERQMLADLGRRFYNKRLLSDVKLRVGDRVYRAHKLLLARASDVLERMLCSTEWTDAAKQEVELHEEPECQRVFSSFLEFLYTCRVMLCPDTALPMLVLADKYNVDGLRDVCVNFARTHVIPKLQLKDVFHVWFQYATRCRHRPLISACVSALSERMDDVAASTEWETEWLSLDRDQLVEFIRSSELTVKDEWELWQAVVRWLEAPKSPGRVDELTLNDILPHIRFAMMSANQLCDLERHPLVERYQTLFAPYINKAYKYLSLSLAARTANAAEFPGPGFLLRNYTETRWDKRLVLSNYASYQRCSEVSLRFQTRASAVPPQSWEWELKVYPKGFTSTSEDCRMVLYSNLILDHARPVEFQLSIVDDQRSLITVAGKKNFCKNRYTADTEMEKKLTLAELSANDSPYLVNGNLILQVALRPCD